MVFGEIVEPSSRALWEDDFVEYPEDEGFELKLHWDENLVPETINKLLIGETTQIVSLLQKCVLQSTKPLCELTIGLSIYKIENNSYVVIYKTQPDIIIGKVTEKLVPWLKAAQDIYILTSAPVTSLQNYNHTETSPCVIRSLLTKNSPSKYSKLEVPNLVTGMGASVLSYSIYKGLTCSLYIGFLDEVSLDSLNTQALTDLLQYLGISPLTHYVLEDKPPSNNLYM